jgi:biotin-dependent carboxylase-like uncharacterized protein
MSKESAYVTILRSGPGTSIQDLGRRGMAQFGVPCSGAMDQKTLRWVNHLLNNQAKDAAIEISHPGFTAQFESPTQIVLAGAKAAVKLNKEDIPNPTLLSVQAQDVLEIGGFQHGARVYLGIRHGFQTEESLGSRSLYKGLTKISSISVGDKLAYLADDTLFPLQNAKINWSPSWFKTSQINVFRGPDFHLLSPELQYRLLYQPFTVSNLSNRMGLQLTEILENSLPELPTNPVYPGTVQLTSGGKLLVLLQDAQVTGGYPRILQLDEESRWIIAQKKMGDEIYFRLRE